MALVRGLAWGILFGALLVSVVASVMSPDMTPMRLLMTFWPNYTAAAAALVVLGFTETRGML